ncbi:Hpt domain-containing protein [Phaeovulum sp.]|uniref:Hpt domain-containing protein n=1 Tax=Phaeovulum sp. TaxID=2934796 RepID=UPI002731233C|nr:Hpt domain-containing protein [Phaeovulum sp.]MDP1669247.1 Hpt domain-containing protein [Phaeovulum sp.]MDZ4119288.1 Hpt domain-containing protein [Phaeovulum sp.]
MIDWERVAELRDEIGEEGFAEVLELFLDEVEAVVARLGAKPERLEDELHFLKGSAWNLGFAAFGAACQDGERMAAAGSGAAVNVQSVVANYASSKAAFMARAREFCTVGGSRVA